MHIRLVSPAPRDSLAGNRTSANRWARLFRRLGHGVTDATDYRGEPADVMVALHAWRSADAIARFATQHPERPLVVVLTGTDVYRFIHSHPETTLASLDAADHLVGLHALVGNTLPERLRPKLRVIVQSARPLHKRQPAKRSFRVCFAGHLREVASHVTEMAYQHHRFNVAALRPLGDFALHVIGWTGRPPSEILGVLDGYSPVSGAAPADMGAALAALRADTGEYVWHFQAVHHDIWDYDLPCPPVLVTVKHGGRRIDAAAQATKRRPFNLSLETLR